jgi:hypothetical protein
VDEPHFEAGIEMSEQSKRIATLRARAALLGLELVPEGRCCWKLMYRRGGDIGIYCITPTLAGIEAVLRQAETTRRSIPCVIDRVGG